MLTPEYLERIPDSVVQLFQDVEDDILRDMARRIKKMDGLTDTASYQAWRLEQTQLIRKEIVTRLSKMSGKTQAEIRKILQEAGTEALLSDDALYTSAGLSPGPVNDNPALLNLLNAGYQQTAGTFANITATTANTATQQFERALDRAWLQVSSGAFDYQTVLRRTVDALAKEGIKAILYPSGHSDTLEVATRRALLTGVNQTAAKLQLARMDEMECDLVEVTAHSGARPSHAAWQGKIYSRSGKSSKYPPFSMTGYGSGPGLCGWNCRHNFYPYWEGLSRPNYTQEDLDRMEHKEFNYNGQEMTRYEASQYQRYLERNIRAYKRQYLAEEAAGVDTTRTSAKLAQWRARQKDFLDKTGLDEDNIRHRVSGFGHRQASKAAAQAKKYNKSLQNASGGGKIKTGIPFLDSRKTLQNHDVDDCYSTANPKYRTGKEYQINCQRCVQAYEFRRRGYDVTAGPKISTNSSINWGSECFIPAGDSAYDAFTMNQTESEVKKELSNAPDGARYTIYVRWKGRYSGAHVFIAEKISGALRYVDPQTGNSDASGYFAQGRRGEFGFFRMDDKTITSDENLIKATLEVNP